MKALTYVEIDVQRCSLTYGTSPCTATITGSPVTGDRKCYNSPNTCQDTSNYAASFLTLRFAVPTEYLPKEIPCIPSINNVSTTPQVIHPGESLGERESVSVSFGDHPFNDVGIDKYQSERGFDPYTSSTFWSKFAARWPYIQGRPLRVIRGYEEDVSLGWRRLSYTSNDISVAATLTKLSAHHVAHFNYSNDEIRAYLNNGDIFTEIGTPVSISVSSAYRVTLTTFEVTDAYTDICFYESENGNLDSYRFSFLTNTFSNIESDSISESNGTIEALNSTDIVFIGTAGEELTLYRRNGSSFTQIGNTLSISPVSEQPISIAKLTSSTFAVLKSDGATITIQAYSFDGSDFSVLGNSYSIGDYATQTDARITYIAENKILVTSKKIFQSLSFDGSNFSKYGDPLSDRRISLAASCYKNDYEIFFSDDVQDALEIYKFDYLSNFEIRHYIVDKTTGPGSNGVFQVTAKDYIKLLDSDKAQAPIPSNGVLDSSINAVQANATLSPAGIGNAEYPSSGYAHIGEEQVSFTRTNDALIMTRGIDSDAEAHDAGDTVQLGIDYDGEDPSDIIYDLIDNYTDMDVSLIDLEDWKYETETYIGRQYSRRILRPTSVRHMIDELIEQVGLVIYSDTINRKVVLRALRQFIPLKTIDDNVIIEDSIQVDEQQDKRVSQVWTFCGQINPIESAEDEKNYSLIVVKLQSNAVATLEGRQEAIKKIFSPWITVTNRAAAEALNSIILARYENAPRKFMFRLPVSEVPVLASGITIQTRNVVNDEGIADSVLAQIISINKTESNYAVVAEEMTFAQNAIGSGGGSTRIVYIDQNTYNVNLRTLHDQIYTDPVGGEDVQCIIGDGVFIGSTTTSSPAFDVGSWPAGSPAVDITIINKGRIQGCGGNGGAPGSNGNAGGVALYTTYALTFDNEKGQIYGGGGGGGGINTLPISTYLKPGGGGAGFNPGAYGSTSATTEVGGDGFTDGFNSSGDGGDPGEDGTASSRGQSGGTAGDAVDGDSYVTFTDEGDIRGDRTG